MKQMKNGIRKLFAGTLCAALFSAGFAFTPADAADASSKAGIVSTASSSLNVRASASTSASVTASLQKGGYVTLISKSGSFWKVEYASGKYGYAHGDYIKEVSSSPVSVNISSGSLNVRSGGGTSYAVTGSLSKGRTVLRLSESGGWSRIVYDGVKTGYVSSAYLKPLSSASAVWPVPASRRITQHFAAGSHLGLDIGASTSKVEGDTVLAAMSGTVLYAGWLSGYGYVIYINSYHNGQYLQARYAHLQSASLVSGGQWVNAGQKIALMGNSGTSSGAHLHFEVRVRKSSADCFANADSTPVNPMNYLPSP